MASFEQNPETRLPTPDIPDRVTGWKDVAAYVGKSIRTAQRWEKQCKFPVHRITTPNGEVVYAIKTELDEWVRNRDKSGSGTETLGAIDGDQAQRGRLAATRLRSLVAGAGIGALVMLAAGAGVIFGLPIAARTVRTLHVNRSIGPAGWRVVDGRLKVFNASDEELWEYKFPFALDPRVYVREDGAPAGLVAIVDLENDGAKEVLFVARGANPTDSALFCFDAYGAVRFSVRPRHRVRFGDVEYCPPFEVEQFQLTAEADHRYTIWLVAAHHDWFPAVLQKLTHTGDVVAEYWNDGRIDLIREAKLGSRRVMVVAGANDEFLGPSVSVLDYDAPAGSAPADARRYTCEGCGGKPPLAAFVAPFNSLWSEINLAPRVDDLLLSRNGYVTVTLHGIGGADSGASKAISVLWMFDEHFRVLDVQVSDLPENASPTIERAARNALGHEARLEVFPILRWLDGRRTPTASAAPVSRVQ